MVRQGKHVEPVLVRLMSHAQQLRTLVDTAVRAETEDDILS
jgi:hypothetical protein